MKKILFTLLLTLSGSLYAAPLQVITSFSILNDIAQQIGGEHIQAESLVGADADAHAYQLNSADLK
ncbi:MAG: zinc ABC transporter substrate-binding protein, partial [Neisseriaceae bacterium]|nr:zinc ABC transporter substrate-binding protein [Neisseriaceae bacterium]